MADTHNLTITAQLRDLASPALIRMAGATRRMAGRAIRSFRGMGKGFRDMVNDIRKQYTRKMFTRLSASIQMRVREIVRAFSGAIKEFAAFEKGMAEVATITDFSTQKMASLGAEVSNFATQYAVEANDAAKALYMTISAGIPQESALLVMGDALKFGKTALVDASTSVDLLTTVLNSYGLAAKDSSRVSDILFATIRLGKTTGAELAGSLGRVTSIAASAGLSLEDLSASMVALTRAGLSTDESATSLRGVIAAIAAPTQQTKKAIESLTAAGIDLSAFTQETLSTEGGIFKILDQLGVAAEGNMGKMQELIPNIRALVGALAVTGQAGAIPEIMEGIKNSMGDVEEGYEKMASTGAHQLELMGSSFDAFKRAIGAAFLENEHFKAALEIVTTTFRDWANTVEESSSDSLGFFSTLVSDIVSKWIPSMLDGLASITEAIGQVQVQGSGMNSFVEILSDITNMVWTSVKGWSTLSSVMRTILAEIKGDEQAALDASADYWRIQNEIADHEASREALKDHSRSLKSLGKNATSAADKLRAVAASLRDIPFKVRTAGLNKFTRLIEGLNRKAIALGETLSDGVSLETQALDIIAAVSLDRASLEASYDTAMDSLDDFLESVEANPSMIDASWFEKAFDTLDFNASSLASQLDEFPTAVEGMLDKAIKLLETTEVGFPEISIGEFSKNLAGVMRAIQGVSDEEGKFVVKPITDKAALINILAIINDITKAQETAKKATEELGDSFAEAGNAARDAADVAADAWVAYLAEVKALSQDVGRDIGSSFVTAVIAGMGEQSQDFKDAWTNLANEVKLSFAEAFLDRLFGEESAVQTKIFDVLAKPFIMLGDWVNDAIFSPMIDAVGELFSPLSEMLMAPFRVLGDFLKDDVFAPMFDGLKDMFSGIWNIMNEYVFQPMINGLLTFFGLKDGMRAADSAKEVATHTATTTTTTATTLAAQGTVAAGATGAAATATAAWTPAAVASSIATIGIAIGFGLLASALIGGMTKKASGGNITGPGGIDNVPAWLTAGEYVIKKSSVDKLGLPMLDALNATGAVPAFASGGSVGDSVPRMRKGGILGFLKDFGKGLLEILTLSVSGLTASAQNIFTVIPSLFGAKDGGEIQGFAGGGLADAFQGSLRDATAATIGTVASRITAPRTARMASGGEVVGGAGTSNITANTVNQPVAVSFNIQAHDAAGFDRLLQERKGDIVSMISTALRTKPGFRSQVRSV